MLNCRKMLIRKLNFLRQIIFFFDKEFKKIIINPYFYQHLFSALIMCYPLSRVDVEIVDYTLLRNSQLYSFNVLLSIPQSIFFWSGKVLQQKRSSPSLSRSLDWHHWWAPRRATGPQLSHKSVPLMTKEHPSLSYSINSIPTWTLFDSSTKSSAAQWTRAAHSSRASRLLPVSSLQFIHLESISTCPVSALWEALSQW